MKNLKQKSGMEILLDYKHGLTVVPNGFHIDGTKVEAISQSDREKIKLKILNDIEIQFSKSGVLK